MHSIFIFLIIEYLHLLFILDIHPIGHDICSIACYALFFDDIGVLGVFIYNALNILRQTLDF